MMNTDTIAAIATSTGHGGIGIIRVSGPRAFYISRQIFHSSTRSQILGATDFGVLRQPQRLYYGHVMDPATGQTLDEALMVQMPGPHSYTREDVVEFQIHGGPMVLHTLLQTVLAQGARLAEPGEFTRRAFLNGRIDLTQAEAVADMIQANSAPALNAAVHQLGGALGQTILPLIDQLSASQAEIEAGIEFPDETGMALDFLQFERFLSGRMIPAIQALADSYQFGHILREGLRLAIVGRPNVGKSSLLNALVQREQAIVTPVPGTTRDVIEAPFYYHGVPILAVDTAGLHPSEDPVERIGIQRARDAIVSADLAVLVLEAVSPFGPEDRAIFNEVRGKSHLIVVNKIDLLDDFTHTDLPAEILPDRVVFLSALTGQGIPAFKEAIMECYQDHLGPQGPQGAQQDTMITNQRQKACIDQALGALLRALNSTRSRMPEDVLSMDLQNAIDALRRLLGHRVEGDILDMIFQRFCIGK